MKYRLEETVPHCLECGNRSALSRVRQSAALWAEGPEILLPGLQEPEPQPGRPAVADPLCLGHQHPAEEPRHPAPPRPGGHPHHREGGTRPAGLPPGIRDIQRPGGLPDGVPLLRHRLRGHGHPHLGHRARKPSLGPGRSGRGIKKRGWLNPSQPLRCQGGAYAAFCFFCGSLNRIMNRMPTTKA